MHAPALLDAAELRELVALARRVRGRAGDGAGSVTSARLGRGFEHHGHDPYRPGDDPRHLDWRARLRTGALWIRRFRAEGDGGVRIVLDDSASMAGARGALAARLAAALAVVATAAQLPVAVDGLGGGGERARLDGAGARRSMARLRGLAPGRRVALPAALARAGRAAHPDEQVIVVSDLADPAPPDELAAAIARLARRVTCVHVIDARDAVLGADVDELCDPESPTRRRVGDDARAGFAAAVEAWRRRVVDALAGRGVDLHVVDAAHPRPLVDVAGEIAARWG
jgi:uncharacterized protein (DUF58 family)